MTLTTEPSTLESTTEMLAQYVAARLEIDPSSIDVDRPVFGVDGAAVGPVTLDSMQLVEMVVDLEGYLGLSLLCHFDDFDQLSIAAMSAIVNDAFNDRAAALVAVPTASMR